MDLKLINQLNESHQYRSKAQLAQTTAREVADFAFMDLVALWILYNEFEFAPRAIKYAEATATFNRFTNYRQMGTDLYHNLHILTQRKTELISADEADTALLGRIELDERQLVRYLRGIASNNMNTGMARMSLQRFENALYISNSNYRSARRLAQNWPRLQTAQKRTVITRMLFFYRVHARRSEIYKMLKDLARTQNLEAKDAKNPELSTGAKVAMGAAAFAGGFAAGRAAGKRF